MRHQFYFSIYTGSATNQGVTASTLGGTTSAKINIPYAVTARRIKSGTMSIWLNGTKGNDATDNVSFTTTNTSPLMIGCQGSGSGVSYGDFNVGEIIIFARALNDAEIKMVHEYLSQKWGIRIN